MTVYYQKSKKGNAKTFKRYLKRLIKHYNRAGKMHLILDNVRYHHTKLLKPFLENVFRLSKTE